MAKSLALSAAIIGVWFSGVGLPVLAGEPDVAKVGLLVCLVATLVLALVWTARENY